MAPAVAAVPAAVPLVPPPQAAAEAAEDDGGAEVPRREVGWEDGTRSGPLMAD